MAKYVGVYNKKGKHDIIIVNGTSSNDAMLTIMSRLKDKNYCGLLAVIPLRQARVLARRILKD